MEIQKNIALTKYNTFGITVNAKRFVTVTSFYELQQLLKTEKDLFLISGGSNMLLTEEIEKLVVHIDIKGISIDNEADDFVNMTVNAGENWHDFVLWCINQGYGGLENLSLIPGNVGTCPIQNIGAYGVEVKDVITKVMGISIATEKPVEFSNVECKFGYRDSIFKHTLKGKVILTAVSFRLTKKNHQLNTSYGAIENELLSKNIKNPTLKNVSDAVIAIRKSKLPDPKEIGNSGSFFKNPVISKSLFKELQKDSPNMPSYPVTLSNGEKSTDTVKVPAGWLIEKINFKGKRFGDAGVHQNQALVLVNYGNASGKEIYKLAKNIQKTVFERFKISLEIEVNVL